MDSATYPIHRLNQYGKLVFTVAVCQAVITFLRCPQFFTGILLLGVSCWSLVQSRHCAQLFVLFIFNAYVNYSIVVGEYLDIPSLGVREFFPRPEMVYADLLLILLLWNTAFSVAAFLSPEGRKPVTSASGRPQPLIAMLCSCALLWALITGVDRTPELAYRVRISPIFEYGSLFALCGLWFAGSARVWRGIMLILIIAMIYEDLRFGGRITSARLLITIYLVPTVVTATNRRTCILFLLATVLMALQGASRGLRIANIQEVMHRFLSGLCVFDTVVFSFYASATHLLFKDVTTIGTLRSSFFSFLNESFTLGLAPTGELFNVTSLAADAGFPSVGGGVAPSFFYFWGGLPMVALAGLLIGLVYASLARRTGTSELFCIVAVAAFPRWYLYGPWILPKTLFLLFLLTASCDWLTGARYGLQLHEKASRKTLRAS